MATSLQGQFLVAAPQMRDPNFYHSVILLLEHSDDSAMGLVVNRPSSISVDAAMMKLKHTQVSADPIFAGGPVETSALFILHNCSELGQNDEEVIPGVFVTGSNESFESLISKDAECVQDCSFRIYCGYAGWGGGQLEGEIDRGDWLTLPADGAVIFNADPYNIWETSVQQCRERNRLLPHNVKNPEWN